MISHVRCIQSAARCGEIETVKSFLSEGHSINETNTRGWFPLSSAVWGKKYAMARFLLENGAKLNQLSQYGWSPLYIAVWRNDLRMVKLVLRYKPKLETKTKDGWFSPDGYTPLHLACENGKYEICIALIKAGANVNVTDNDGQSPLYIAISRKNYKIATALALHGARIRACQFNWDTNKELLEQLSPTK